MRIEPFSALAPETSELESRPRAVDSAFRAFLARHPDYADTAALDELRAQEFSRLDRQGAVYLDYTGGGLAPESLVRRHGEWLLGEIPGNPHSENPASLATTERVESCRRRILEFFRADPAEWVVIFTANASHALKLVGESYPFEAGDRLLLTFDNHNSVNGIREFDRAHGADTRYVPLALPEMRVDETALEEALDEPARAGRAAGHHLFAYPAQSNFSGVRHPLEWIERAQGRGWDVLLDAAAFVPTARLDLSRWRPDYVALSFYKMFGHPTGVGALLGRREALAKLHRPWFAGGTIAVASVQADRHYPAAGAAAFEDGTLPYTQIPAVEMGLDFLEAVDLERLGRRLGHLTEWLLAGLTGLRHGNGRPLAALYGPRDTTERGATVAFNFLDPAGRVVDHRRVELAAGEQGISLRTGCFCNPGAGELALGLSRQELVTCFDRIEGAPSYESFEGCIHHDGTGAVRVSLGLASDFADVHAFLEFARSFVDG